LSHARPNQSKLSDPPSVVLGCPYCGVRQRVDLFDWKTETLILIENFWFCPQCGIENRAGMLGTVALVTRDQPLDLN
jgi:hypothetical protein